MAFKIKESEGIALLSMYGDEDDGMEEDIDTDENNSDNDAVPQENKEQCEVCGNETVNNCNNIDPVVNTTPVSIDDSTRPPLSQQVIGVEPSRGRKGTLRIVDYGHDEAGLSPDAEEGEIVATGLVMFGAELQTVNGTPSTQSSEQSESDAMNYKGNESEAVNITEDGLKEMDPLDKFLPPPPTTKCSVELQEKIDNFMKLTLKTGRTFNSEVRNRKAYRNPDFLLHTVAYQDIDQIGSCFSKDIFDPHGYEKSDYYDDIEADLKRKLERRKEQDKKIDFLSGRTAIPMRKFMAIPGSSSVPVETGTHEGRPNKKSKWDKADEDKRLVLTTGGQDLGHMQSPFYLLLMATKTDRGRGIGNWIEDQSDNFNHLFFFEGCPNLD